MKLRALELEQFRKFDRPVRLTGFGDRVNVLCGPNEFGKSTILAAIKGLLFERYNSKAAPVRRMQSLGGDAAPKLAMEFETGNGLWRIEKRFLHQPMAKLTAPGGGCFDNDAAEEELQRLLGFGPPGSHGAKAEQMGVWGALWVTQRDSVAQANLTSPFARATITSCLDAEVGVLTGNEKGEAIKHAIRDRRGRLLDGNGKPTGPYRKVREALNATDASLDAMRVRAAHLADDATRLQSVLQDLDRANNPQTLAHDHQALREAREQLEAAQLFERRLSHAKLLLELARTKRADASGERRRRAETAVHYEESSKAVAEASATLREAVETAAGAERDLKVYVTALDASQRRADLAALESRRLTSLADLVRQSDLLDVLTQRLEQAQAAQSKVHDLAAQLRALHVDRQCIDALRAAVRERDTASAILTAHATRIEFDIDPTAAGLVTIEGQLPATTVEAVNDTEIAIAGVGRISVRPAIKDRARLSQRVADAEDALRDILRKAGCSDTTFAEGQHVLREQVERQLADAAAALSRLVPAGKEHGLTAGIAPLRAHVDDLRKRVELALQEAGLTQMPDSADAVTAAGSVRSEESAAAEALAQARAERDTANALAGSASERLARAQERMSAAKTENARLADVISATERKESSESLLVRSSAADTDWQRQQADVESLEEIRQTDAVDGLRARIGRYEEALASRQRTIAEKREEIVQLRTSIAHEGGHGLDEQIAALERDRAVQLQEHAGFVHDCAVLDVLSQALNTAEQETKKRYLGPVKRRVEPYLRSLFPGAGVECDETLRITELTRGRLGREDFERLSDGTQEQIAVLSRLAFAEMLIDQGKPAMVILDDALAYADAERMERMFDVLSLASQKTQILVLTCREDLFARLGGSRIEVTAGEPALLLA